MDYSTFNIITPHDKIELVISRQGIEDDDYIELVISDCNDQILCKIAIDLSISISDPYITYAKELK